MTAAARLYARLEPLAYDDENQDFTLQNLCAALATPREIFEVARDVTIGDVEYLAWESVYDPDVCPEALLDWLAVFAGVVLPPSALTVAEKRSRILQAAGRYRGTERAWKEEIARTLTDTQNVRLVTFVDDDRWSVLVVTGEDETPDPAATERAARAGKPAGIILTFLVTDDPLINEGSLTINAVTTATIDTATLDDVT